MNNLPECVLVVGPESSGTRVLTRLLIAAGAYGDGGHGQRLDRSDPPADCQFVVWRRSFPHGKKWPSLPEMIGRFVRLGFRCQTLVCVRHPAYMSRSQVSNGHSASLEQAGRRVKEAYRRIVSDLASTGATFVLIPYESLEDPGAVANLFSFLNLPEPREFETLDNMNRKYL